MMKKNMSFALLLFFMIGKDILGESTSALSEEEILKNPAVAQAHEKCRAHYEKEKNYQLEGGDNKTMGDCIWGALPAQIKEHFLQVEVEADKNEKLLSPTVDVEMNFHLTEMEKKSMSTFKKYLKKKLAEAIDQSFNNDKETFIDITTIYQLYEHRVGKNIIEAVSSFCLDANMNSDNLTIQENKEARMAQRKRNLSLLNILDNENIVAAYRPWGKCILNISSICYKEGNEESYTKRRACEVSNYIHAAKQGLITSAKIRKALEKYHSQYHIDHDVNIYTGGKGQVNLNEATTLTSKEIEESTWKEEVQNVQVVAKECQQQLHGSREELSYECQKFFITEEEEKDQENKADIYSLQAKVKSEQMKHTIDTAQDREIEEFINKELEALGVDEEEKENFLSSLGTDDPREILRELTQKRYDAERTALNQSIQERLDEINYKEQYQAIGRTLVSRVEEYKQLLHFNNIVSSFLKIEMPDGENVRNTTSLSLEIKSNSFLQKEGPSEEKELPWGRIDHRVSEELQHLGESIEATEDLPILSPEQVNILLKGKKTHTYSEGEED